MPSSEQYLKLSLPSDNCLPSKNCPILVQNNNNRRWILFEEIRYTNMIFYFLLQNPEPISPPVPPQGEGRSRQIARYEKNVL